MPENDGESVRVTDKPDRPDTEVLLDRVDVASRRTGLYETHLRSRDID